MAEMYPVMINEDNIKIGKLNLPTITVFVLAVSFFRCSQ